MVRIASADLTALTDSLAKRDPRQGVAVQVSPKISPQSITLSFFTLTNCMWSVPSGEASETD